MNTDWIVTARVFAEAYERLEAGEFGAREFVRGGTRWVVVVSPNRIEAKKLAPIGDHVDETHNRVSRAYRS